MAKPKGCARHKGFCLVKPWLPLPTAPAYLKVQMLLWNQRPEDMPQLQQKELRNPKPANWIADVYVQMLDLGSGLHPSAIVAFLRYPDPSH